jgi:LEA14-like dessication related protein
MKLGRWIGWLCCWLLPAGIALAQIQISEVVQNVGRISKEETPVVHEFIIKNQGVTPLSIQKVIPDCACSTVSFTQSPIAQGKSGTIKVVFAPYKMGPFQKIFTVHITDPQPRIFTLKLEGYIAPSPLTPEASFPYISGVLRFRHKNLNFGSLARQSVVSKRFEMYNAGTDTIFFTDRIETPTHIRVYFDSSLVIPPGKIGSIVVTYDPKLKKSAGFFQENVVLFTKNAAQPRVEVNMIANLLPTEAELLFSESKPVPAGMPLRNGSTANPDLGPRMQLSETVQNLGDIYLNVGLVTEFVIYNEGGKTLEVFDIKSFPGCEVISEKQFSLAPQEFAVIQVRFIHNGTLGKQIRQFVIKSNDELQPEQMLEMQVNVIAGTK